MATLVDQWSLRPRERGQVEEIHGGGGKGGGGQGKDKEGVICVRGTFCPDDSAHWLCCPLTNLFVRGAGMVSPLVTPPWLDVVRRRAKASAETLAVTLHCVMTVHSYLRQGHRLTTVEIGCRLFARYLRSAQPLWELRSSQEDADRIELLCKEARLAARVSDRSIDMNFARLSSELVLEALRRTHWPPPDGDGVRPITLGLMKKRGGKIAVAEDGIKGKRLTRILLELGKGLGHRHRLSTIEASLARRSILNAMKKQPGWCWMWEEGVYSEGQLWVESAGLRQEDIGTTQWSSQLLEHPVRGYRKGRV